MVTIDNDPTTDRFPGEFVDVTTKILEAANFAYDRVNPKFGWFRRWLHRRNIEARSWRIALEGAFAILRLRRRCEVLEAELAKHGIPIPDDWREQKR